jgi:hypothetical protein
MSAIIIIIIINNNHRLIYSVSLFGLIYFTVHYPCLSCHILSYVKHIVNSCYKIETFANSRHEYVKKQKQFELFCNSTLVVPFNYYIS